jgi:hypothetical protein
LKYEELLVRIFIPAFNSQIELFVPLNLEIKYILPMLASLLNENKKGYLLNQNRLNLYDLELKLLLRNDDTLNNYNINSNSLLILI